MNMNNYFGNQFKRKYQHAAEFGAYNTQETYRETDKSKFWLINLYQSMNKILSWGENFFF